MISTDKVIVGGTIAFTIVALIFIVFFAFREGNGQKPANIVSYAASDKKKPQLSASSFNADMGKINVNDEKKAEFSLKNTGSQPLTIFGISSSCDCTYGKVTIDGKESPEFTMHSQNSWTGTIAPGKSAKLSVIYRPFIMPVKGIVTRDVYLKTNDPKKSNLTFTIKADVE